MKLCANWRLHDVDPMTGVATLCGGLRENHSLVKLDLDNKGVGYEGCMALGQLLGHHPTLCDVALGRNALLDTCVEALLHDVC